MVSYHSNTKLTKTDDHVSMHVGVRGHLCGVTSLLSSTLIWVLGTELRPPALQKMYLYPLSHFTGPQIEIALALSLTTVRIIVGLRV